MLIFLIYLKVLDNVNLVHSCVDNTVNGIK